MTEMKRLRVSHLVVQPMLVWDDGAELEPGPPVDALTLPLSKLTEWAENLPAELVKVAEQLGTPASA